MSIRSFDQVKSKCLSSYSVNKELFVVQVVMIVRVHIMITVTMLREQLLFTVSNDGASILLSRVDWWLK